MFPTHPRFLWSWSAIILNKWKLKFVPSGTLAMDFAHYQLSKLLGFSLPITHLFTNFNFWCTFHFPPNSTSNESRTDFWQIIIRYICKLWDGWQKVKSLIIWDFQDIWKPGLSNYNGDSNENIKKAIVKQQPCMWKHLFGKCPISHFMEDDVNKQRWVFLSLSKLECGPQRNQCQGNPPTFGSFSKL